MAIVGERLNPTKPGTPVNDPKKLPANAVNNNKDLDVDLKKDEGSFFQSFFPGGKATQKKKVGGSMEAVSHFIHHTSMVF